MTLMYGQYSEVGALTTFLLSGRHDFPNTLFGLKPLMPCCRCHHCPSHSTGYQFLGWRHGVATESFPVGGWCWKLCLEWNVASADVSLCRKFTTLRRPTGSEKGHGTTEKKTSRQLWKPKTMKIELRGHHLFEIFAFQETFAREAKHDKAPANSKLKRRSHPGDEKVGDFGINIRTPSPCCRQQKPGNECWQFMSLLDCIVIYELFISQGRSPAQIGWNARVTMEGPFIHWRCAESTGWLASRGCSQRYFVS